MRVLGLLIIGLIAGAARGPSEYVVRGDGMVGGTVNGVPARIRIDPAATATPILTTALAQRARLKAGPFDFEYLIGPKRILGQTAVTRLDFGLGSIRRRVGWTAAPYRGVADAVIGPGLLPVSAVRFELRPTRAGERVSILPMVGQGGIEDAWGERFALIDVGGSPLRVHFDPGRRRTIATASAGARIARAMGGHFSGAAEPVEIVFGVVRPVRSLQLERPLLIGPLSFRELGVRTHDFGSVRNIPEANADPDEIVVVARGKKKPKGEQIKLGADVLDRCSSIVFDRAARQIRLSCR
jgi:hypothetical protein